MTDSRTRTARHRRWHGDGPTLVWITLGAVALRLLLLSGRGHYVAFDEGWYLLLGRNLWSGDGYTLSGLRHVALSPLFPILAGALDRIIHDAVWAGRIIAAVSSGLLVLPCWYLFRRLATRRAALIGGAFVALLPSLAPFVVPYWIGWDLWVGAEPLFHFFLFSGLALFVRAWEQRSSCAALACGTAFALSYLARPEAVVPVGLLALVAVGLSLVTRFGPSPSPDVEASPKPVRRSRPVHFLVCVLGFVLFSAPYWVYLQDALGHWTLTGRWVPTATIETPSAGTTEASSGRIEDMLWRGDDSAYIRSLYALAPSGTTLANGYWGIRPPRSGDEGALDDPGDWPPSDESPSGAAPSPEDQVSDGGVSDGQLSEGRAPIREDGPSWLLRYAEALGVAVPWYVWLIAVPGLFATGRERRLDLEVLVGLPLVTTSVLIARVVAIDPRTQLFIAPLAAFYAARGVLVGADRIGETMGEHVRTEIVTRILVGAVAAIMLGTSAVRLVMSLTVGSPHHVVAAENAVVGEAIRETTAEDATVMSFHPALALFADRDWRVLPLEPMDRIVRYARTQPNPHLVLSVFYPPELRPAEEPHYLVVPVPSDLPESDRWRIDIPELRTVYAFGELVPME